MQELLSCSNGLKLGVLCGLIVSLTMLDRGVTCELKHDAQFEHRQPFLEQDDDVTSAPDPLLNPQSRRMLTEVHYVA